MIIKTNRLGVLFAGMCALILSLGIARYSFTPMIPVMQAQMGVTESLAGWLAGWNYMGYLTGLLIVWLIKDLRVKDFFYRYGLIVAVVATALMAAHENRLVWYVSRYFAGIASAMGFMLGTGMIINWLHHNNYGSELGTHFMGIGFGIVLSALVVDLTSLDSVFAMNWRFQWLALAGIGVLLLLPALLLLPPPGEKEVEMGHEGDTLRGGKPPSERWLWLLQVAYFFAGFSNTLNVTFTSLITELQPLEGMGAKMWLLVGLAAIPAPLVWSRVARRISNLNALLIAFTIHICGNLILASSSSLYSTGLAAVLFGFTFMGIVSLTLSTVSRLYGARTTQIMAQLTFGYCVAQILSPILSGMTAELTGSFTVPLYVVSALMVVGAFCLLQLKKEREQEQHLQVSQ